MKVPYAMRSEFLAPCTELIATQHEALTGGATISVQFTKKQKGYRSQVDVVISPGDSTYFGANPAPKRFPSRIKAAATALRDCGQVGRFRIGHGDGTLCITSTQAEPSAV